MLLNFFDGDYDFTGEGIFLMAIIMLVFFLNYFYFKPKKIIEEIALKKSKEEWKLKNDELNRINIENEKNQFALYKFGVKLGTNLQSNNYAYDEIIRIVNLIAINVSQLCVEQDKINRSDSKIWEKKCIDEQLKEIKTKWAEMRESAVYIKSDLINHLPHFSEYEPLKSYNAENNLRKKSI
ncbi:MAG: hypothetical protein WCI91_01055 [Candidatus Nomurabacteria bacterium]